MKLVSWNVNGLRACIQKGFLDQFDQFDADFFCLQETKLSEGQLELDLPGYQQYWCYAEKKGYSGTAIFTKHTPLSVHYGLDVEQLDNEGRLITLEYPEFFLVNCYTPNAQRGLARLEHRMAWDEAFRAYLQKLDSQKSVILCGDLNVAHREIDLKNPKSNRGNAGFSDEERQSFQKTLDLGFTDTFRHLHPDAQGCYSWWSYMFNARQNNAGWRIDYFLISDRLCPDLYKAEIHSHILGSDHCPVSIQLDTLCNGGIWSPMSQGHATQTFPVEKEPKASAVSAKALVPFLAAFVLLLGAALSWNDLSELFFSAPQSVPPESADLFTVHIYDADDHYAALISSVPDYPLYIFPSTDHNGIIYSPDGYFYHSSDIDSASLSESNFWLRVALTEEGKTYCDPTWSIDLAYSYGPDIYLSSSILNSYLFDSAVRVEVIPYYSDSAHSEFAGWFVFGGIGLSGKYELSLTLEDYTCTETVWLEAPEVSIVTPDIDACIIVNPIYTPPEVAAFGFSSSVADSVIDLIGAIYVGENAYFTEWDTSYSMQDARFWFRVELNKEALSAASASDYTLEPVYFFDDALQDAIQLVTIPYYTDMTLETLAGWFVYGVADNAQYIEFNLKLGGITVDTANAIISPYVTFDEAQAMTTQELLTYLILHPGIYDSLEAAQSIAFVSPEYFDTLCADYPALEAFFLRYDAVETALCYDGIYASSTTLRYLIDLEAFQEMMTPGQEARYLLGLYADNKTLPSFQFDRKATKSMTTAELVSTLAAAESDMDALLFRCSGTDTARTLYWYLQASSPMLAELASRSDALPCLQSARNTDSMTESLSIIPLMIQFLSDEALQDYSSLTTAQLVHGIMHDYYLVQETTFASDSSYAYYENLLRAYPELAALMGRTDAVEHLLYYDDGGARGWEALPTALLSIAPLRYFMTPQQEADFLTGNYPTATSCINGFDLPDIDLAAMSTWQMLTILRNMTDFGQILAACSTDASRLLVYDHVRSCCNILPELEARSDTMEAMYALLTEFTPTLTLDSCDPISFLYPLWPDILSTYLEERITLE